MRSLTSSRNHRSWVTTRWACVGLRCCRWRASQATPSTSRWLVGSSRTSRSHSCTSSAASATRRRSPPDIVATVLSRPTSCRPSPSSTSRTRASPAQVCSAASPRTAWWAVRCSPTRTSWVSTPTRSPPAWVTRPDCGSSTLTRVLSSVVLPPPLRPTTPIRSPSEMPSDTASSSWRVPWLTDTCSRLTRLTAISRPPSPRRPGPRRRRTVRQTPAPARAAASAIACSASRASSATVGPAAGHDDAERPELAPGVEHAPQRRAQRQRGGLQVVGQRPPHRDRVARAQRLQQLGRVAGDLHRAGLALPVELAVDRRGRQAAVGDREHPGLPALDEHAGELLAAAGGQRGAAVQGERHVAAELRGEAGEVLARQPGAPQRVAGDERRGGVGRAAGAAAGHRDALGQRQRQRRVAAGRPGQQRGRPGRPGCRRRRAARRRPRR